ncbi:hypothetical protein Ciccas_000323 [Cichlidogyrus casuarinus]|uniref:CFAP65-like ninth Ig-like domain-containing protein n=1 Tax=Cichlidogyrus casuarinus TaxID=1844966 RepID=A0ABD2QNA7_9PLAT
MKFPVSDTAEFEIFGPLYEIGELNCEGTYPTLRIVDVIARKGDVLRHSKHQLFRDLQINTLNSAFYLDPSVEELQFAMATRAGYRSEARCSRSMIDLFIGSDQLKPDQILKTNTTEIAQTRIDFILHNHGTVDTPCEFFFPEDLKLKLDYWVESGEFTEAELNEFKSQTCNLFDIRPRKFTLEKGQMRSLTIIYRHITAGTHRLPVLMKIMGGREIMASFPQCLCPTGQQN